MRVADDGLGIAPAQVEEIRRRLADPVQLSEGCSLNEKGIGLWNIARRLYLFYQDEGILTFDSVPGQGTTMEIRLPIRQEGEECTG